MFRARFPDVSLPSRAVSRQVNVRLWQPSLVPHLQVPVPFQLAVADVVGGSQGILSVAKPRARVLVDHSTTEIDTTRELAARLAALARLRNLLVHGYVRVNDAQIHDLLKSGLSDLDAYLAAVDREAADSPPEDA